LNDFFFFLFDLYDVYVYRLCNIRHLPRLNIATAADRRRHGRDACGKSAATFKYVTLVIPEIILRTAGLGLTWTDRAPNLYITGAISVEKEKNK
jgi:hypothetical protein